MTYRFNHQLFFALPSVLGITSAHFIEVCGIPRPTFFTYKRRGDMPLVRLIQACNSLHISISHMIEPDDGVIIIPEDQPKMFHDIVIVQPTFQPITFRHQDFGVYATTNTLRTIDQASQALNISYKTFKRNFLSDTLPEGLTINTFLHFCDLIHAFPGDYIIDFNTPIRTQGQPQKEVPLSSKVDFLNRKVLDLAQRNKELQTTIKRLRSEIQSLKQHIATTSTQDIYPLIAAVSTEKGDTYNV